MIKTFRLFLLSALAIVFGSAVVSAQTTVTWDASSKDAMPNISVGNDLTFTFDAGSANQAPVYSTQSNKTVVSMQTGSKLTVAGADANVNITKIVFTYVGDNLGLSANVGSTSNQFADNTSTWTGEANSIEFKAGGRRYVQTIEVTYTGSAAPVVKAPVLAITQDGIADTYDMDANGVFVVYYENTGNAAAENAKLTLYVDGTENASKTIGTLNFGANNQNFWNAKYNLEGIEAGEHQVYLELTADNAETVKTEAKKVTFTKKAPEAAFSISAQAVTVPYDAESYTVVATLTETNNVAATNVTVELRKSVSDVLSTAQVTSIDAGATVQLNLAVAKDLFETGQKTYYLYVNDKYLASVDVTFEEAPEADRIDMAIVAIQGPKSIDLAGENVYTVFYENKGNVTVENAVIKLLVNDNEAGSETVTVEAGKSGSVKFTLDVANLFDEAEDLGLDATIEGFVNVDGDVDASNNKSLMTATVTKTVPQATFEVNAENVTVAYDATGYQVVAKVKNTSETVAAEDVLVQLQRNAQDIAEAQTVSLAAGEEKSVTFTVAAPEGGFAAGETTVWVMVRAYDKLQTQQEVTVTVEAAPVEQVVDMAITAIQGISEIKLNAENKLQVWYENKGTKDLENVAIMFSVNDHADEQAVNVAAGKNGYVEFTVPTDIFEPGEDTEAELVAWVNVDGDVDAENNKVTKTVPVVNGVAELSFEVAAVEATQNTDSFDVTVTVKNEGKAAAENVVVTVYDENSAELGTATIESVAAGAEATATITIEKTYEEAGTFKNQLQVVVAGAGEAQWVDVTVKTETVGIAALKAQYGENVQIFTIDGKKVSTVQKGHVYIVNGKKVVLK